VVASILAGRVPLSHQNPVSTNTFEPARSKFYKSFNAIFGKVQQVASESVIMQLISSKCLPVLLYATEACPFLARDQSSVYFAVTRCLNENFSH